MQRAACGALAVALAVILGGQPASAVDVVIPLKIYLNKPASKTKFVAKGAFALPDPGTDNPTAEGGSITFSTESDPNGGDTFALPSGSWKELGPGGSKGFKYRDSSGATCKIVLVKATVVKGLCAATDIGALPHDANDEIRIVLSVGTETTRYCAACPNGGTPKGDPSKLTKFKDCLAPAACPGAAATTTTTSTTSTTTTSTTTTTFMAPACSPALPSPACDGSCGGPGGVCGDPGGGCVCGAVPPGSTPCGTAMGPPACLGECDLPGEACLDIGGMCACAGPPAPVCGLALPSPNCEGSCGPGSMCADPGGGCMCVPTAGPCGTVLPFPTCLGDCPPGTACRGIFPAAPPGCACY